MAQERLQKILAQAGIASRRHAETLITEGRVRVNGRVIRELGSKADPSTDKVEVDGDRVVRSDRVYVLFHKPRGVVSTMHDPEGRPTVREPLLGAGARVYPIGRLDFATSGALLATNDGDFAAGLLHPRTAVPKEYIVKVHGVMKPADLDRWRDGVELDDGHKTLAADVTLERVEGDKTWFSLILREGHNQQIRRMGKATGFEVMRLARLSFAGISTEGVRPGSWRYLTRDELVRLKKAYGVPRHLPSTTPTAAGTGRRPKVDARRPRPAAEDARRPRYGGGAAGRADLTSDWRGGQTRGRSGDERRPREDLGAGRMGRTRTTGTAGGPRGRDDSPRVKSRRG